MAFSRFTFLLLISFSSFVYGSTGAKISCELIVKTLEIEIDDALKETRKSSNYLWKKVFRKDLDLNKAKDLAEDYKISNQDLLGKMREKATKHLSENKDLENYSGDHSIDMLSLMKDEELASKKYNDFILTHVQKRLAANTVKTSNSSRGNYTYKMKKNKNIEFDEHVFSHTLNKDRKSKLIINYDDSNDPNGSDHIISYIETDPAVFTFQKRDHESKKLSELVSKTLNDGSYYQVGSIYEYSLKTNKPELKLMVMRFSDSNRLEPLESTIMTEKKFKGFVGNKKCFQSRMGLPDGKKIDGFRKEGKKLKKRNLKSFFKKKMKVNKK